MEMVNCSKDTKPGTEQLIERARERETDGVRETARGRETAREVQ